MSGAHRADPPPVTAARRRRPALLASLVTAVVVAGSVAAFATTARHAGPEPEPTPGYGVFGADVVPDSPVDRDETSATLGVSFSTTRAGLVTAVEVYRGRGGGPLEDGALWSSRGTRLATAEFPADPGTGWVSATLSEPVRVVPGRRYVASYDAPEGGYAGDNHALSPDRPVVHRALTAWRGVYTRRDGRVPTRTYRDSNYYVDVRFVPDGEGTTTPEPEPTGTPSDPPTSAPTTDPTEPTAEPTTDPTEEPTDEPTAGPTSEPAPDPEPTPDPEPDPPPAPEPDPAPGGNHPDAASTGVPAGTVLTPYTGPCTITRADTVIEARTVSCDLEVRAPGLQIRSSVVEGTVGNDENTAGRSFTITDSEVRVGDGPGTGIGSRDFVATRVEVTGGNRSINCWMDCTIRDSWVHGQFTDETGTYHESGIRMGARSTIVGNTIACDAPNVPPDAGCSAGLTGYGDFAAVRDVLVQGNLFLPTTGGTCAYGGSSGGKPYSGQAASIRFLDNVFARGRGGRCGVYAAVMDFDRSAPGNQWSGNVWQDGGVVSP